MASERTTPMTPQLVVGLFVIVLGILFTLDNLDLLESTDYLRFWPLLLIVIGFIKVLPGQGPGTRLIGLVFVVVGGLLLLETLGWLRFNLWAFWPLILVFVGLRLILRALTRGRPPKSDSRSHLRLVAILGGVEKTMNSQDFRGGELTAVLGSCDIDLHEASITESQAVLDVFALFGGINLGVPKDWFVVVEGLPLLGGFTDKTRSSDSSSGKRLVVKGMAIMGGVDISN